jgi:hypothetical protein
MAASNVTCCRITVGVCSEMALLCARWALHPVASAVAANSTRRRPIGERVTRTIWKGNETGWRRADAVHMTGLRFCIQTTILICTTQSKTSADRTVTIRLDTSRFNVIGIFYFNFMTGRRWVGIAGCYAAMAREALGLARRSIGMRFVHRNICERIHVENHTVTSRQMDASELKKLKSWAFSYRGAVSWPNTDVIKLRHRTHTSQEG